MKGIVLVATFAILGVVAGLLNSGLERLDTGNGSWVVAQSRQPLGVSRLEEMPAAESSEAAMSNSSAVQEPSLQPNGVE